MFEVQQADLGETTLLVHVGLPHLDPKDIEEFQILATSAGAEVMAEVSTQRQAPDAKYFIGSGKANELAELAQAQQIKLVLIDHDLTPAQERNLERLLKCRVLDRTGLILDIFAQRARTFEGKLQVELAQLQHLSTRLVRGWTHLERQKGGIGLRGPGETQLETDRRLLRERIKQINRRLAKVQKQRQQSRQGRQRANVLTLSLVGYTNAGKSTLFNQLTQAEVYAADQLFATLDPTLRRVELSHGSEVVLADTVGFIRHLPHDLVEAFQATLEETKLANLLIHVIDASDEHRLENIHAVVDVLRDVGADSVSQLQVYNKVDLLSQPARIDYDELGRPIRVWLSAATGEGIELLKQALTLLLAQDNVQCCLRLLPGEASLRAALYRHHAIVSEVFDAEGNALLEINLPAALYQQLFN